MEDELKLMILLLLYSIIAELCIIINVSSYTRGVVVGIGAVLMGLTFYQFSKYL